MKNMNLWGGLSALYLGAAYMTGIVMFLVVLDYPGIVDAGQKVELLMQHQQLVYTTNLLMYVMFGFVLIILLLSLYDRLKGGSYITMQAAAAIGVIWAGALIMSGMVANAGIAPTVTLYEKDPSMAALYWTAIESVSNGLGGANGEILGGSMTLLVSWVGLRSGELPKWLNYVGLFVGVVGVLSTVPGVHDLTGLFGITQMIWFVSLGIILLGRKPQEG